MTFPRNMHTCVFDGFQSKPRVPRERISRESRGTKGRDVRIQRIRMHFFCFLPRGRSQCSTGIPKGVPLPARVSSRQPCPPLRYFVPINVFIEQADESRALIYYHSKLFPAIGFTVQRSSSKSMQGRSNNTTYCLRSQPRSPPVA